MSFVHGTPPVDEEEDFDNAKDMDVFFNSCTSVFVRYVLLNILSLVFCKNR